MKSKWLLALYPEPWRIRYQDEFAAMLDECPASPRAIIDVIIAAIDAQLNLERIMGRQLTSEYRLHRSVFANFGTYILFAFGIWLFYSAVDDSSFVTAMKANPKLAIPWLAMEIGFALVVVAIAITNFPIALTVLRQLAINHNPQFWLVSAPILSMVGLGLYLVLMSQIIDPIATPSVHIVVGYGFWIFLWSAIIGSAVAICRAIRLSNVPQKILSFSLIGEWGTTVGMSFIVLAAGFWLMTARHVSLSSFNEPGLLDIPPTVTFLSGILCMSLAIAIKSVVIQSSKLDIE